MESGKVLGDAYAAFCALLKQGELESVRREFKAMVGQLIRDEFDVALRNDLVVDERQGGGWKNLRLSQTLPS